MIETFLQHTDRSQEVGVMAHTHCTGQGQGQGWETMGFYIMLCTVHTTQGLGQGQRPVVSFVPILVPVLVLVQSCAVCMSH